MKLKYYLCILLILSFISLDVLGNEIPFIKNYNKSDYNAGQANRGFVQDQKGVLYIANSEGLLVYNGQEFNLHYLINKTQVLSIGIDTDENIVVGGQGEFGYFKPNERGILTYNSLTNLIPDEERIFSDIRDICVTPGGIYYKSLEKLFYWDKLKNEIKVYKTGSVIDKIGYVDEVLYLDDSENGLFKIEDEKLIFIKGTESFKSKETSTFLPYKNSILITTWQNGIYLLNKNSLKKWKVGNEDLLKQYQIKVAALSPTGTITIGTNSGGVLSLNESGEIINILNRESGLKKNSIQALFYDSYDNMWIGFENGINYLKTGEPFYKINPNIKQELMPAKFIKIIFI